MSDLWETLYTRAELVERFGNRCKLADSQPFESFKPGRCV